MADLDTTYKRSLIRYDRAARRVWVLNQRLHHGAVGVVVIVTGAALAIHDRKDWKDWFRGGLQGFNPAAITAVIDDQPTTL